MKILVLNWRDMKHPEAGGAEVHFTEIFRRLVQQGHSVTLLTTRFKGSSERDKLHGIEIVRWGSTYLFNWQAPFLIRKLLKGESFDCIIDDVNKLPFLTPWWFPKVPSGALFHHLFGKTVFELAPAPFAAYVYAMERMYGIFYRGVPCCAVSKSTSEELLSMGIPPEHMIIIENSVHTDELCPSEKVKKEKDLLLYVGRLKRYKRIDIVLDAMKILREKGKNLRFYIAGSGDDELFLRERCKNLGLEQQVTFGGQITEEQKIELFRKATLFVNTSLKEGWGITNIEAAACGTAVVANDAPGLRDSVIHGKTGLLYKENDVNSLAESISELVDNAEKRSVFEHQGREWALRFSWDSSAKRVEQWLSEIISQKR